MASGYHDADLAPRRRSGPRSSRSRPAPSGQSDRSQGPRRVPSTSSTLWPNQRGGSSALSSSTSKQARPLQLAPGTGFGPTALTGWQPCSRSDWCQTLSALSAVTDDCGLDWDPAKGTAQLTLLSNLPLAHVDAAFVSEAVSAGVTAGTRPQYASSDRLYVLPLLVALNLPGKRRHVWDMCHLNSTQSRGLPHGNPTAIRCDVSAANQHVHVLPDALPYLVAGRSAHEALARGI